MALVDRAGKVVLDSFSGEGGLAKKMRAQGLTVLEIELAHGPQFDLTRRTTQLYLMSLIRSGRVWYVHMGVPCTVWSQCRRNVQNFKRARAKELISTALTLFVCEVVREASRCGVFFPLKIIFR